MGFWKDVLKEMGRQAGGSWGVRRQLGGSWGVRRQIFGPTNNRPYCKRKHTHSRRCYQR